MGVSAGKQKRTLTESNPQRKGDKRNTRLKTIDDTTIERRPQLIGIEEDPQRTTETLQDSIVSKQELYDLPLEMLDVILQKSYLHWILNTPTKQRDDYVIRSLISVDVCFNRRITRQRFKKGIWRCLKDFYEKTMKRSTIIRNNRNYLLKTIQPSKEFISSLLSFNCVTEEQGYFIQRQSSKRKKNSVLLEIMRSFNEIKVSNFGKCLRQNKQTEVARIVSKGGAVYPISLKINFTQRIETPINENVYGVTKLRNEIFVLCCLFPPSVICVFEDRNPFRFRSKIKIKNIKYPYDIESSEKENCLYVSDSTVDCIWKITKEKGDEYDVMKWLTTVHVPTTISVSIDGNLLMVNDKPPILMIYGSDAAFIGLIHFPTDIERPIHAVETSIGNFIILHLWREERKHWSGVGDREKNWVVSEMARDGQEVIRRFSPAHEAQKLNYPCYISLDSEDRVFVADEYNDRVILLDFDLEFNQIVSPSKEELKANRLRACSLCYDKEKNQLIVGSTTTEVTIYTLSQN